MTFDITPAPRSVTVTPGSLDVVLPTSRLARSSVVVAQDVPASGANMTRSSVIVPQTIPASGANHARTSLIVVMHKRQGESWGMVPI